MKEVSIDLSSYGGIKYYVDTYLFLRSVFATDLIVSSTFTIVQYSAGQWRVDQLLKHP